MNLRPYQSDQIQLIRESFAKGHKRVILCSPTGSGKSVVMAEMIRQAYEKGTRVIVLTHRIELFKSMLKHIGQSEVPCVELAAGAKMPTGLWDIMVAMERTIWNRIKKEIDAFPVPGLFIIDEGHLEYFTKIIKAFPHVRVVMFSATPKGKHIHELYTDLIQNIDIPDLIEQGFLVTCKAYQMEDRAELDKVKMKGGEFDEADLFKHFNKSSLYKGLVDEYKKYAPGQKGLVFCVNIEHTVKTYTTLLNAGLNAFMIHSGNKEYSFKEPQREKQVKAFEASTDGIMVNGGILTTGYDHNKILWIGFYRATTSLELFLQICGRGSRPILGADDRADLSKKSHFTILDFGSNHTRHGLWNQPRKWKIQDPKRAKKERAAPVKTCDGCGAMLFASIRKCEFCGKEFPAPTFETIDGVMVEVNTEIPLGLIGKRLSDLSIEELVACQKTGKLKATYVWRILRTREKESIDEKGKEHERFIGPYAEIMKYKFGWVAAHYHKMDEDSQIGFNNFTLQA